MQAHVHLPPLLSATQISRNNQQPIDRTKASPYFFFNIVLHSNERHNMEEKICRYSLLPFHCDFRPSHPCVLLFCKDQYEHSLFEFHKKKSHGFETNWLWINNNRILCIQNNRIMLFLIAVSLCVVNFIHLIG